MDLRSVSPLVLVGGLVAAGFVGFVTARQLGGPEPAASPSAVVAEAPVEDTAMNLAPGEGTEAIIEPADVEETTPAPAVTPRSAAATPTPVPARRASSPPPVPSTPARSTRPEPAPAPTPAPARAASRPAPASARTSPSASTVETPDVEVARSEPTWSRPFPAPEATASLPSRTAPRIDAPPPPPVTRSVTLPADAVVGLQIERSVSTDDAKVEDEVRARVTRDVLADGVVVIPAGTRVNGSVTYVDEGGKVRERARLGVRFHTLVLADGTEVRMPTETIYRDGESPAGRSAAKIGGSATAGAVIGAILGGGKGAAIGAAIGAGGGTAATMAGGRRPARLPAGQTLTVRISDPVTLDVPR